MRSSSHAWLAAPAAPMSVVFSTGGFANSSDADVWAMSPAIGTCVLVRFSPGGTGSPQTTRMSIQSTQATHPGTDRDEVDRKSTRLNSSHLGISYAVFCL